MPNAAGEPAGASAVAPIAPAATPVDVLIPTCARPAALAVTLASLIGQTHRAFAVLVSDQGEDTDAAEAPEVRAQTLARELLCAALTGGEPADHRVSDGSSHHRNDAAVSSRTIAGRRGATRPTRTRRR